MPRPITKKDLKLFPNHRRFNDPKLGLVVKAAYEDKFAYQVCAKGYPYAIWVSKKTLRKRQILGHPKKRVKQIMREPDFGLEEMALAESIINGG